MGIQGFSTEQAGKEFAIFKPEFVQGSKTERLHLPNSVPHKELYSWQWGFVYMVPLDNLRALMLNGFLSAEMPLILVGTCDSKTRRPFIIKTNEGTIELGYSRSVTGDKAVKIIPCNPEKVWYDMKHGQYFVLEEEGHVNT